MAAAEQRGRPPSRRVGHTWLRRHALNEIARRHGLSLSERVVLLELLEGANYETWLYTGTVTQLSDDVGMTRETISKGVQHLAELCLITITRPFTKLPGIVFIDCFDDIAEARFHPSKPASSDDFPVTSSDGSAVSQPEAIRGPSDGLVTSIPSGNPAVSSENTRLWGAGEKEVVDNLVLEITEVAPETVCVTCKRKGHASEADEQCDFFEVPW
jgi:hypothetical protein